MLGLRRKRRALAAVACLAAVFSGYFSSSKGSAQALSLDEQRAIALLGARPCSADLQRSADIQRSQVAQAAASTPSPAPSPVPTPGFPGAPRNGTLQYFETPRPVGSPSPSAPPLPLTVTPVPSNGPVFLQRGGETPPPITPAGQARPPASPQPAGVPTLAPGYVAIIADRVSGNTRPGHPGDAEGNVHIYYGQDEIVGDKAHYDGDRTVTITGHPFIVDQAHDSILNADAIYFDTIDQTAKLVNGRGESSQGVERGLVHYNADDLHTDANGVGHGLRPYVTTCEHPRGGYHITGRNMDIIPGDRIVIYRAILWLGAAAVFFLPKVVIPLRTVEDQRTRPQYFPDVGYDQYEGFWVQSKYSFGRDQYYYGYYVLNYYTKVGLGLGYVAFFQRRNGRRSGSINFYHIHDRRVESTQTNLALQETENFSRTLRSNVAYSYQSNFGPLTNLPANSTINLNVVHQTLKDSQDYTFTHSSVGTQSSSNAISFSDTIGFTPTLSEALNFSMTNSQANYGGFSSSNASATIDSVLHWTTRGADYQLTWSKSYSRVPYGDNKIPELAIRPYAFFPHFVFPVSAQFTIGQYSEPSNAFSSQRADLAFVLGPALYRVFGSDFQATVNVNQYAYGTGDLKASIQQLMTLTTPITNHIVNTVTYNEANYNGPPAVPFQYLDQQPTQNAKGAQDLLRFFNGSVYNLALGFSTLFDARAQPVSYQLQLSPSPTAIVLLGGSFIPGPHMGFEQTNVQFSTPFGRDTQLEFAGNIDWNEHRRIVDKIVYLTKTIGQCYQIQVLYNQDSKLVNVSLNLLAFPSHAAGFGVGQGGPIIPSNFNF
ncbi:MAG TPA: hypothetical protein VIN40_00830 [Candidatus Tyrphobacter sp.]